MVKSATKTDTKYINDENDNDWGANPKAQITWQNSIEF